MVKTRTRSAATELVMRSLRLWSHSASSLGFRWRRVPSCHHRTCSAVLCKENEKLNLNPS